MRYLRAVVAVLVLGGAMCATAAGPTLDAPPKPSAAASTGETLSRDRIRALFDVLAQEFRGEMPARDDLGYDRRVDQVWALAEAWVVAYLDANPGASAREVAADLAALLRWPADGFRWSRPTAVALTAGAEATFVVTLGWDWAGTFFVVAQRPSGCFEVAWRITDLARHDTDLKDDLDRWATYQPGFHDGALVGRPIALSSDASGRPRFCIDATSLPGIGQNRVGQVSVWTWTGERALPELLRFYTMNPEAAPARLAGDTLEIRTNEDFSCFSPCGMCLGPQGTWRLRVRADGVDDLGTAPDEPELHLIDEVLHRIALHQDARDLAAGGVVDLLVSLMPTLDPQIGCWVGLIGSWKVDRKGGTAVVHFSADETGSIDFRIEPRNGRSYIVSATVRQVP